MTKVAGENASAAADIEECSGRVQRSVNGFIVHQLGETTGLISKTSLLNRTVRTSDETGKGEKKRLTRSEVHIWPLCYGRRVHGFVRRRFHRGG